MFLSRNPSDNNERYQVEGIIGRGTYGDVYKAIDKHRRQVVAIKTLRIFVDLLYYNIKRKQYHDEGIPAYALGEISILKNFHHPNIVK